MQTILLLLLLSLSFFFFFCRYIFNCGYLKLKEKEAYPAEQNKKKDENELNYETKKERRNKYT